MALCAQNSEDRKKVSINFVSMIRVGANGERFLPKIESDKTLRLYQSSWVMRKIFRLQNIYQTSEINMCF